MSAVEIVEVAPGDARLDDVYPVMHELRDELSPEGLKERYAQGYPDGYRLLALYDDGECRAAAGYRVMTNLVHGRILYIDDLVTAQVHRSAGYGRALEEWILRIAAEQGCERVTLDSGVHRAGAHKFYFRQGYAVTSFHFGREVRRDVQGR